MAPPPLPPTLFVRGKGPPPPPRAPTPSPPPPAGPPAAAAAMPGVRGPASPPPPGPRAGTVRDRRVGDPRLGEVECHVAARAPPLDPVRHEPAAIPFRPAAPAVDADDLLRLDGLHARREARCGRQVSAQRRELAVGARGQRLLQPLVELFGGQPAIARGYPQQFSSPVPVLV